MATSVTRSATLSGSAGTWHSKTLVKPDAVSALHNDARVSQKLVTLSSEAQRLPARSAAVDSALCSGTSSPR